MELIVHLTATPAEGWVFSHWTRDLSGSANPTSITITGNTSVTAHFTHHLYTLTITTDGAGMVTKNPDQPTYTTGQDVTLTAQPSTGWIFTHWTGDLTGTQNPTTITMTSNKTITAHFQDNQPPQITSLTRTTSTPLDTDPAYGWVNISATITDNVAVSTVLLHLHTPTNLEQRHHDHPDTRHVLSPDHHRVFHPWELQLHHHSTRYHRQHQHLNHPAFFDATQLGYQHRRGMHGL
jgi:uncharacterized repeat protein (TIGR02543 family)